MPCHDNKRYICMVQFRGVKSANWLCIVLPNLRYRFHVEEIYFVVFDYPDWGFSRAFSSVVRQIPGWYLQRRGTARTLPNYLLLYAFFVLFYAFFCVLCIVYFVTFPVLFVCKCVLNICHRVATQLQLNIYYHHHTFWWTKFCTFVGSICTGEVFIIDD
jgi:hypothetical protein